MALQISFEGTQTPVAASISEEMEAHFFNCSEVVPIFSIYTVTQTISDEASNEGMHSGA